MEEFSKCEAAVSANNAVLGAQKEENAKKNTAREISAQLASLNSLVEPQKGEAKNVEKSYEFNSVKKCVVKQQNNNKMDKKQLTGNPHKIIETNGDIQLKDKREEVKTAQEIHKQIAKDKSVLEKPIWVQKPIYNNKPNTCPYFVKEFGLQKKLGNNVQNEEKYEKQESKELKNEGKELNKENVDVEANAENETENEIDNIECIVFESLELLETMQSKSNEAITIEAKEHKDGQIDICKETEETGVNASIKNIGEEPTIADQSNEFNKNVAQADTLKYLNKSLDTIQIEIITDNNTELKNMNAVSELISGSENTQPTEEVKKQKYDDNITVQQNAQWSMVTKYNSVETQQKSEEYKSISDTPMPYSIKVEPEPEIALENVDFYQNAEDCDPLQTTTIPSYYDDVQIIEMFNFPIFIDLTTDVSDSENDTAVASISKQAAARKAASVNAAPKMTTTELNAKAKSPLRIVVPKRSGHPKSKRYLPKNIGNIVEIIEILDSSSGDEKSSDSKQIKKEIVAPCNIISQAKYTLTVPTATSTTTTSNKQITSTITSTAAADLNSIDMQSDSDLVTDSEKPLAFYSTMLNKKVVIPNVLDDMEGANDNVPGTSQSSVKKATPTAPAANGVLKSFIPPQTQTEEELQDFYWIVNFLTHFCNPHEIVSDTSLELLQRVLQCNVFERLQKRRQAMNKQTYTGTEEIDFILLRDISSTIFVSTESSEIKLSELGRTFCLLSYMDVQGTEIPLTIDVKGDVTSATRLRQKQPVQPKPKPLAYGSKSKSKKIKALQISTAAVATSSNTANTATTTRKRRNDDDDYNPGKLVHINDPDGSSERKRSLRARRARHYDEDDFIMDYNSDSYDSTENSHASARAMLHSKMVMTKTRTVRRRLNSTEALKYASSGDMHNLLKPTWIEWTVKESDACVIVKRENIDEEFEFGYIHGDIELEEYRIFKRSPNSKETHQQAAIQAGSEGSLADRENGCPRGSQEPEFITCDYITEEQRSIDSTYNVAELPDPPICSTVDPADAPKNTDRNMHSLGRKAECVLCKRIVSRIVLHYVNDHPEHEVYNSRLSDAQLLALKSNEIGKVRLYKNGQVQFEGKCIFCQKESHFTLTYWYQHFSMHTGEYAYRCDGCQLRKPTRSMITSHINQPCPQGVTIKRDFVYDQKVNAIEAFVCKLCNYIQLHQSHVIHHLQGQHNITHSQLEQVETVVLLQLPQKPYEFIPVPNNKDPVLGKNPADIDGDSEIATTSTIANNNATLMQNLQWEDLDDNVGSLIFEMLDGN